MTELNIEVKNGEVVLSEQVLAVMNRAKELNHEIKKYEIELDTIKEALKDAMEKSAVKTCDTDDWHAEYVAESVRTTVDTKALKEQGLFEMFSKTTKVKPSLRLTFKE